MERRLATIMAVDVVGYSRLMGADEENTLAMLKACRRIVDAAIAEYGGRIFGGAGDSVMTEFPSPVQAVRCAREFQRTLDAYNRARPRAQRMDVRVGINFGDVIVEGDDLYGDVVNVAERLQALADAGGICLSDNAYRQVHNKVPFNFEPLGRRRVKNIADPILVYRLRSASTAGRWFGGRFTRRLPTRRAALAATATILLLAGGSFVLYEQTRSDAADDAAGVFPDIVRPSRHFRVDDPARLADADAMTIYDRIVATMSAGYAKSGNAGAAAYRGWRRYNTVPYLSATHGNRYVNNYGNALADKYGTAGRAVTMPVGAVLAKDSFEVTERGDVISGALGLMEKMPAGFNPPGRDWRYTMIMPDGTLFGTTNGRNSERVEFCMACHIAAGDDRDHLFFVPDAYRVQFLDLGGAPD